MLYTVWAHGPLGIVISLCKSLDSKGRLLGVAGRVETDGPNGRFSLNPTVGTCAERPRFHFLQKTLLSLTLILRLVYKVLLK